MQVPPSRRRPGTRPSDANIVRFALGLLVVLLVSGGALLAGSFIFGGSTRGPGRPAPPTPSALPTRAVTTSRAPNPSAVASVTSTPSTGSLTAFLRGYLTAVTNDPAAGWAELTPAFRNSSGGFAAYQLFWGRISRAQPSNIKADPDTLTVRYDVAYTLRDGSRTADSTRLTVTFDGGQYLIDGEG